MLSGTSEARGVFPCREGTEAALPSSRTTGRPPSDRGRLSPVGRMLPLSIKMPVSYAAFCAPRRDVYTRYAAARVGCPHMGEDLAQEALGDLAMVWAEALQSASPAALAWSLLRNRIAARALPSQESGLYRALPGGQADALMLRYRVGLPLRQAADLVGVSDREMAATLRTALRTLAEPDGISDRHMRGS